MKIAMGKKEDQGETEKDFYRERRRHHREHTRGLLRDLRAELKKIPPDIPEYIVFHEKIKRYAGYINGAIRCAYSREGFSSDPKKSRRRYERALQILDLIAGEFDDKFEEYETGRLEQEAKEFAFQHPKKYKGKKGRK